MYPYMLLFILLVLNSPNCYEKRTTLDNLHTEVRRTKTECPESSPCKQNPNNDSLAHECCLYRPQRYIENCKKYLTIHYLFLMISTSIAELKDTKSLEKASPMDITISLRLLDGLETQSLLFSKHAYTGYRCKVVSLISLKNLLQSWERDKGIQAKPPTDKLVFIDKLITGLYIPSCVITEYKIAEIYASFFFFQLLFAQDGYIDYNGPLDLRPNQVQKQNQNFPFEQFMLTLSYDFGSEVTPQKVSFEVKIETRTYLETNFEHDN